MYNTCIYIKCVRPTDKMFFFKRQIKIIRFILVPTQILYFYVHISNDLSVDFHVYSMCMDGFLRKTGSCTGRPPPPPRATRAMIEVRGMLEICSSFGISWRSTLLHLGGGEGQHTPSLRGVRCSQNG
jgi:hypothetical protein